ncbi:hypothetical protein R1sor_027186 [Riccia sorocarpa]|uniref:Endonuclease/exonuclease/phosphatase domain-containing protein n=1 Tax=Riccia sorocarpa TaxID=122646 RepID=A0ABD3GDJ1_9MARC
MADETASQFGSGKTGSLLGKDVITRLLEQMEEMHGLVASVFRDVNSIKCEVRELRSDVKHLVKKVEEQGTDARQQVEALKVATEEHGVMVKSVLAAERKLPAFEEANSGLEGKIKSYAEVARTTQTTLWQEQEHECVARETRSLNLRIVGLEEKPEEVTRDVAVNLFTDILRVHDPKVAQATRIVIKGGGELWAKSDIVVLLETWEYRENAGTELPGFVRLETVWNSKRGAKGRGFGGIVVWTRETLTLQISVEHVDKNKQFVCLRLPSLPSPSFLIVAYFAPFGARIYSNQEDADNPFVALSKVMLRLQEVGSIWLMGDFNSRSGTFQGQTVRTEVRAHLDTDENDVDWVRESVDTGRNGFSEAFIQMVLTCGLTVLNGTKRFPNTEAFTYQSEGGASVTDYVLSTADARDRVKSFVLEDWAPESDHRALFSCLSGFDRRDTLAHRKCQMKGLALSWDKKNLFRIQLTDNLKNLQIDSNDLTQLVMRTAKNVFTRKQQRKKEWFDIDCERARKAAMSGPTEDRFLAFREYKKLVRTKKRAFLCDHQAKLTEDLIKDPRAFWSLLRTRGVKSELGGADLYQLVNRLYYFPDAHKMPTVQGAGCCFSESEVAQALGCLGTGKASDLYGLQAELLRWDLRHTHQITTTDLHSFFVLPPYDLGCYVLALEKERQVALADLVASQAV